MLLYKYIDTGDQVFVGDYVYVVPDKELIISINMNKQLHCINRICIDTVNTVESIDQLTFTDTGSYKLVAYMPNKTFQIDDILKL